MSCLNKKSEKVILALDKQATSQWQANIFQNLCFKISRERSMCIS